MSDRPRATAVVIGSSGDIGGAICERLKRSGRYSSVIGTRNRPGADVVESGVQLDVSEPGEVVSTFRRIAADHPGFRSLCIAVGTELNASALTTNQGDIEEQFRVNAIGPFNCCAAASRHLFRKREGEIVVVSSIAAAHHLPGHAVYGAARAALERLVLGLGHEVAPRGIRVNVVRVGAVKSRLVDEADPVHVQSVLRRTRLGRLGSVEMVAKAADFLLSPDAADITLQTVAVDGGYD
jgi:NAD(P)-dependent dehydrogenase (short-subunit alcohol dehydrogenase family)